MQVATKQLNTRIVLRNDSTANWLTNEDQVLLKGELGIEFLESGAPKIKIGDGVTTWKALAYFGSDVKEAGVFKLLLLKVRLTLKQLVPLLATLRFRKAILQL